VLLGAAALAYLAPADAAELETVELVMTEYRFTPDRLRLEREVPYRLRLENHGKELHELTAPDFFASIALETPEVLTPGRREVVVQPGERKELRFVPLQPGRYPMLCADHDWAGMIGEIIVA
jgi:plastocyanin